MEPIRYLNRHSGRMETERVYGEGFLRWTYHHPLGALALASFIKRPFFSVWYGRRMDRPQSARRIAPFITRYGLDVSEFADTPESFASFNEFFFRKLRPECRPIDTDPESAVFPADGRHFGFADAADIRGVFVKGQRFDLPALLGDAALASRYAKGALVLSRLCPVDYHRFHFPVAGVVSEPRTIGGPLFSVSPIALRKRLSYLWTNRRMICAIDGGAFGTVLVLQVGATCVGGIHQTFRAGLAVAKGGEQGYFSFGGSSVITLFEPGRVVLADDLLDASARGVELFARFGSVMARLA